MGHVMGHRFASSIILRIIARACKQPWVPHVVANLFDSVDSHNPSNLIFIGIASVVGQRGAPLMRIQMRMQRVASHL